MSTGYWWNGYSYAKTKREAQQDPQLRLRFTDPAGWRDRHWVDRHWAVVAPVTVGLIAALPLVAFVAAISCFSQGTLLGMFIGVLLILVGIGTAPYAWRVLSPAAEIRRIERDLHDGAQAHLVALGLALATAERLLVSKPEEAMKLIQEARKGAATSHFGYVSTFHTKCKIQWKFFIEPCIRFSPAKDSFCNR